MTNEGVLHPEIRRHYMRIRPPEKGEAYACESCGLQMIHVNNRLPDTRTEFAAREIVDAGFLELVRYGVRRADDPLIVDSLRVVDAVLKRELPCRGPDGCAITGTATDSDRTAVLSRDGARGAFGQLLTGERAH